MSAVIHRVFVFALSMTCAVTALCAEIPGREGEAELSGPYRGQKPPGPIPEVFAPGIVSLSPDGKYLFYTLDGDVYWLSADFVRGLAASVEP